MDIQSTMDKLPNEILQLILSNLELVELLNASLVSSRFKFNCDQVQKDLKRLAFTNFKRPNFELKELNKFQQLNWLELGIYWNKKLNGAHFLSLPKLKSLNIYTPIVSELSIILKAPKLEDLKLVSLAQIKFELPNTIKRLVILNFDSKISVFKNLELLNCSNVDLSKDLLTKLEHLKYLILPRIHKNSCFFHHGNERQNELKDTLVHILQKKLELKRPDFKICFQDMDLTSADLIKDISIEKLTSLKFRIQNYNLLHDNLIFDNDIDYTKLMQLLNGSIPADFFQKFTRIESVQADEITNSDHFIWFLSCLNNDFELELNSLSLDQQLLDGLAKVSRLSGLEIYCENVNQSIDFNFLLKIVALNHTIFCKFVTNLQFAISFDLALKLLKKSSCSFCLRFIYEDKIIEINKCVSQIYNLFYYPCKDSNLTFSNRITLGCDFDFNKLVMYCNYLKDKDAITTRKRKQLIDEHLIQQKKKAKHD